MNLYWVTTEDHDEDWFVVAKTKELAEREHEESEGYDPGDASASFVLHIPERIVVTQGGGSMGELKLMGAEILPQVGPHRVVRINGKVYCEGVCELLLDAQ